MMRLLPPYLGSTSWTLEFRNCKCSSLDCFGYRHLGQTGLHLRFRPSQNNMFISLLWRLNLSVAVARHAKPDVTEYNVHVCRSRATRGITNRSKLYTSRSFTPDQRIRPIRLRLHRARLAHDINMQLHRCHPFYAM